MTTPAPPAPPVLRLNGGRPLLERVREHPWENRVTFNPACALVTDPFELSSIISSLPFGPETRKRLQAQRALCFLLYRAQGERTPEYDHTRSAIGLAVLSADLKLLARHTAPVLLPDREYDNLGVEDGRITRVGDRYFMFYCAYSAHPEHPNASSANHPGGHNQIRLAVASTRNFVLWEKHGLLDSDFNNVHNKNAMLLEGTMSGHYTLLHRPMEGEHAMAIHWATSSDPLGPWKSKGHLMSPQPNPVFKDTWIGGGAPPLLLSDGRSLMIFHIGNRNYEGAREYDLGLAVLDFRKREIIEKRIDPWLRPESPAETQGDTALGVNNVVFICGAYFYQGDLYFPYAGADSVVVGGMVRGTDLRTFLGT